MKRVRVVSLRTKFVLAALIAAVVPLTLMGLWLTRTAERSGRQLLEQQLHRELVSAVERVQNAWLHRRSDLLLVLESAELKAALAQATAGMQMADSPAAEFLERAFQAVQEHVETIVYRDTENRAVWSIGADATGTLRITPIHGEQVVMPAAATVLVSLPLTDGQSAFEARVRISSLLPNANEYAARVGGALTVLDQRTGQALLPTRFDAAQLAQSEFRASGEPWLAVRQSVSEPPITFVLAAPLEPYIRPFERAAQQGTLAVLAVVLIACGAAVVISRRLTRSLERLAIAADAVAHGQLDQKVSVESGDEVGRLARAFNVMTESLQRTLRELSQRQALAAVGEFASALAHEVRNPLTSIRLDLQLVQERIPPDSRGHTSLARALKEIERLNRTVSDGLKVARSGRIRLQRIDLREPLEVAAHAAAPEFAARGAQLEPALLNGRAIWVRGDAAALKQLFLNLLINAAQALEPGGRAGTRVETAEQHVTVSIWDKGSGIPEEKLRQIWEPFFSTKEEGTGLGLAISQRIVVAHGGEIEIDSAVDRGTTFRIRLPLDGSRSKQPA